MARNAMARNAKSCFVISLLPWDYVLRKDRTDIWRDYSITREQRNCYPSQDLAIRERDDDKTPSSLDRIQTAPRQIKRDANAELTGRKLAIDATACRGMACQDGERAKAMVNLGMRGLMKNTATRAAALAERFKAARTSRTRGSAQR
jgi:hypothetical protein